MIKSGIGEFELASGGVVALSLDHVASVKKEDGRLLVTMVGEEDAWRIDHDYQDFVFMWRTWKGRRHV